ncbi:hypothetical protein N2152v2_005659 [Parachlorella kessleri]
MPGNKAVQVLQPVPNNPLEGLAVSDTDIPSPGPGQVLIKLYLRTINPVEFFQAAGFFKPQPPPFVIGIEGVGVVEALGPDTSGPFRPGQRVVGINYTQGTFQQYVVEDEKKLYAVPDEMSDDVAAQFYLNPFTALALVDTLDAPKGAWILQTAAGSAVGRIVIQLAKHKGVKTINVVRREAQAEELKQLGADEVLVVNDETPEGELASKVQDITGGEGAYGAAECVGDTLTGEVVNAVRPGGTTLVYGNLSHKPNLSIPTAAFFRGRKVDGCSVVRWLEAQGDKVTAHYDEMARLLIDGVVTPYTGKRFPLESVKEAMEESTKVARGGKVLLEG